MRFRRILRFTAALLAVWYMVTGTVFAQTTATTPSATVLTTGGDTTATTDDTAVTDATEASTETTTTTATTAPPTDPIVPGRYLIEAGTPLDAAATWHATDTGDSYTRAVWNEGRRGGRALQFDGRQYMTVNIAKCKTPFTLSFWTNWQADMATDAVDDQYLFALVKQQTENGIYCMPLSRGSDADDNINNGMSLSGVCYLPGGWQRQTFFHPASETVSNALSPGVWHHIALTVEERTVCLYVDGILWQQAALSFDFANLKADALVIGAGDYGYHAFTGLMQDFMWYDGTLSAMQIARIAGDHAPFDATVTLPLYHYEPAAPTTAMVEKNYFALTDGGKTAMHTSGFAAFWEAPVVDCGQSITGTLSVENKSKHIINVQLNSLSLPVKGSLAYRYLSTLHLLITDESAVLYNGSYADLTMDDLNMVFNRMTYNRRKEYTITISRPFASTENIIDVRIPWEFSCELADVANAQPRERQHILLLIVLIVSAVLVVLGVYWMVEKDRRRLFAVFDGLAVRCQRNCNTVKKRVMPWISRIRQIIKRK